LNCVVLGRNRLVPHKIKCQPQNNAGLAQGHGTDSALTTVYLLNALASNATLVGQTAAAAGFYSASQTL
jgi:Na+-translocating ferredoxin:NAD+ oxidoreductase RnfE subunit